MAINNTYPATSPYFTTETFMSEYLDIMTNRPIPMLVDDVYFVITRAYEYRPDLLAFDLYSDAKLWWVFSQRNPNTLKDPLFDFKTDVGIYIPKLDTLKQILGI